MEKAFYLSLTTNVLLALALVFVLYKTGSFGYFISKINKTSVSQETDPLYLEKTSLFDQVKPQKGAVVFLGDSLTSRANWGEFFPDEIVLNRGIGNDTVNGSLDRLDEIIVNEPSKIFIMLGINNLVKGETIDEIAEIHKTMTDTLQKKSPNTEIYIQSVLPVNNELYGSKISNSDVDKLNTKLEQVSTERGFTYLDISSGLQVDNQLNPKYTIDGIHLLGEGYKAWADSIESYVVSSP